MKENPAQTKTDFDQLVNDYEQLHKANIKASGFDPAYFDEHKIKTVAADFNRSQQQFHSLQILNFGCGIGKSEKFINAYFPNCEITSVDVSEKSIAFAKEKNSAFKNISFRVYDDIETLKLDNKFDILFVANVFHHIPDELHVRILKRLRSFLSANGFLYVFEHNPQNPLTKKAFDTCEFDVGCKMIHPSRFVYMCKEAGYTTILRNYVLFFPKFLSAFAPLERFLKWCPLGAQYFVKAK